ncbi:MAG: type II toxin-antitoxin system HicB family antitoxin [Magnetococcus sp. YQC-9]
MKNHNTSKIFYPIVLEPGDNDHAFGVVIPDLPGCFSAGDTLEEALSNAKNPDFAGWMWAVVEVEDVRAQHQSTRVNITLPRGLLSTIDHVAGKMHMTRSGWLAEAAKRSIAQGMHSS